MQLLHLVANWLLGTFVHVTTTLENKHDNIENNEHPDSPAWMVKS